MGLKRSLEGRSGVGEGWGWEVASQDSLLLIQRCGETSGKAVCI